MKKEDLQYAIEQDKKDALRHFRESFHFPKHTDGKDTLYLCGNSLGLQPKKVKEELERELQDWAKLGVEGHFHHEKEHPWFSYHEQFSKPFAHLVGAKEHEVIAMNSLTTNLHLLMVSFYQPTKDRYKIVIENGAFPSDRYAVASQAKFHGFAPEDAILEFPASEETGLTELEDIEKLFEKEGDSIALVIPAGVNFYTGQFFDLQKITEMGHQCGAYVGFDLAHAAGNIPLSLHEWNVDFAVWCSYKYLNSGPGSVAGAFVHEKHLNNEDLPRFHGWWGNNPKTRFEMGPTFEQQHSAGAWQLSNAPVLSMASLKASMDLFTEATMPALRQKSVELTAYLEYLLQQTLPDTIRMITPSAPEQRGAQLSLKVLTSVKDLFAKLSEKGVVCDVRDDVIRIAPTPLYNSFQDVWNFVDILQTCLQG